MEVDQERLSRTACRIALLLLLGGTLACQARAPHPPDAAAAPSEASVRWPIPPGWKHETFALPPGFAPDLPYHGSEDLRFMPGFSTPAAPDWWSYDFVWWLDEAPPFDPTSVSASLTTYFRGLTTAVAGSKYDLDPARYRVVLTAVPESEPPRLTGQVFTFDPFSTGLPITLNVEAELRSCPEQVAIVLALSPKDTTDGVWKDLRATASTLVCGHAASTGPIEPSELAARLSSGSAPVVLDVRTREEFASGHIPGATNVPVGELSDRVVALKLSPSDEIVVHCQHGGRAARAASMLRDSGYTNVRDLNGHMEAWRAGGYPLE